MTIEETLYAEWYASQSPEGREAGFERLLGHLTGRASRYGVRQDTFAAQICRKRAKKKQPVEMGITPEVEAARLVTRIDALRGVVLRLVLAAGSGNWRQDIQIYLERVGRVGLDHLFILAGDEPDNVWADVMPRIMFKPLSEDRRNDFTGRRRDAVNNTLSGMIVESRAQLTGAIVSPAEGVTPPVCLGYCRTVAINLLIKCTVDSSRIVEYDETTVKKPVKAVESDAVGANSPRQQTEPEIVQTLSEAWGIYNQMGTEEQNKVLNQTWDRLRHEERAAIWLSKSLQKPGMADGVPHITPALPGVSLGSGINGDKAARLLALPNKNTFYQRVNRAGQSCEELFISLIDAFLLEGSF
jgi:hypothetical protein